MDFATRLDRTLQVVRGEGPLVLDLFAGCGGLTLGFEARGFRTLGFEIDPWCCETYSSNLSGECRNLELSPQTNYPSASVIVGGPPCQPFSVGGNQLGLEDSRDGFPAFISAVRRVQPEIWLFENVRGMLYGNRPYFDEILDSLEECGYVVEHRLLNAVDFGVPQNRERVICVGHRGEFRWPEKEMNRVCAGEALGKLMKDAPADGKYLTPSMDAYVAKYEKVSKCVRPRDLHPEKPARTLTCRNLAGATGDMHRIALPDGRRRRLNAREAARLQSFPDWFRFCGGEIAVLNQIGNAVAPLFAWHLAGAVEAYLETHLSLSGAEIAARKRDVQLSLI